MFSRKLEQKSPKPMKPKSENSAELLKLATRCVCFLFAEDPTRPSLVISYLPTNQFYISVVRYQQKYAQQRVVLFSTKNASFEQALMSVIKWISSQAPKRNPIDELNNLLLENEL